MPARRDLLRRGRPIVGKRDHDRRDRRGLDDAHWQRRSRRLRRTGPPPSEYGDAEEIAQEAFLRVWTKAPNWRSAEGDFPAARFTTWLYRVVVNLGIDRKRRPAMNALEAAGDPVDPADSALRTLEKAQLSDRVAAAVAALPERQRTALTLCFYEGLSNREAADILALSPGAVESLLVRARRSLREALAGVAAEFLEVSP
jgi:RNA polymerase sigma-70 factor, ECF subfamily